MPTLYEIENASIQEVDTEEHRSGKGENSLVLVHPGKTKLHMRRAIKGVGGGEPREVNWLCAAHNGTYVYVHDKDGKVTVVVTDQDLNP